ncbi:MAG TPA: alpha/beta fold hydrolase [Ramlibacter sp.]|uniref:alpha/beta hydrolase n=1 Tax=Ramlibacter sp. TaxID=1917967 RepID=UPI002D811682|nr:alpha/beta fold hydrolase [Ramlibacter sp.]HET8748084.1 alpha/beta fold hydrolase [Ramlibacter sp.]
MIAMTERLELEGPAGRIQLLRNAPDGASRGIAVIAHPHPLFGGTMENKVVQTLARGFVQAGWTALRFNFRGVGASQGSYDEGRGEAEDFLTVVRELASEGPLALAGFSFGAYVSAQALQALWGTRDVRAVVLVGTAASRFPVPPLPAEAHERALVIHGEVDETVPLSAALDWARPQSLPVTVVPGVEHFFHGQLPLLKNLVVRHLRAVE